MIWAFLDRDEFLEAINRTEHGIHTLIARDRRHARIMGMARQPDFVLVRDRDDAFQKIRDPLPINIRSDASGAG